MRGRLFSGLRDHAKKLHQRAKATFLCQPSTARITNSGWELAFRRHSLLHWGQGGWVGREGGEGALIPGPGNRFLLGHFGFGMGFEKERRRFQGQAGHPVVTPDGVKSKAD